MLQRSYSLPQTERVAGQRSAKGGEEGCAGRVVKDEGETASGSRALSQPSYICLV